MTDLAAFLIARIEEDESVAHQAGDSLEYRDFGSREFWAFHDRLPPVAVGERPG